MPPTNAPQSRETQWEQRLWTLTQVLMVSAMLWVGSTVITLSEVVARIDQRLIAGSERLEVLERAASASMDDRYRGRDARTDWERQGLRDKAQDDRINAIVSSLQDLRTRVERAEARR
jgi:hypothetical protein